MEEQIISLGLTCTAQIAALIGLSVLGGVVGLIIGIIFDIVLNKKMHLAIKILAPLVFIFCGSLFFFGLNIEKRVSVCLDRGEEILQPLLEEILMSVAESSDRNMMLPEISQEDLDADFDGIYTQISEPLGDYSSLLDKVKEPLKKTLSGVLVRKEPIKLGDAVDNIYTSFVDNVMVLFVKTVKFFSFMITGVVFALFLTIAILTAILGGKKKKKEVSV